MGSQLAYGFKSRAERIALTVRAEAGITAHDRLDAAALAEERGIPIVSLADLADDGASVENILRLASADSGFSALTICSGDHRLIVYNPAHPPGRRANSLAHEISHVILKHAPTPALFEDGKRLWNGRMEEEADWLAGALLVPRDGALALMKRGATISSGADHYGVSEPLFRWRINQTGVMKQLQARHA
jgi:Zn-dependent peptidase ImmA (M78 family)